MLRFETPPDKILVAILSSALELQQNYIEELIETETDPMIQWWLAAEPMLARFFDPRTAARLIEGCWRLTATRDCTSSPITTGASPGRFANSAPLILSST